MTVAHKRPIESTTFPRATTMSSRRLKRATIVTWYGTTIMAAECERKVWYFADGTAGQCWSVNRQAVPSRSSFPAGLRLHSGIKHHIRFLQHNQVAAV